ncbi:MAG: radical SAM protein [Minicystis sp.]
MRIAIICTYTHPTRLARKEPSIMQSSVGELIAALCPPDAEIEVYNEKEAPVPLDRDWDIVFFSYLHSYYEHTKVLSTLFRRRGMVTVAGGRHAGHFAEDCERWFDAVVVGDPEVNVPALLADFGRGELKKRYALSSAPPGQIPTYRYDLVDFSKNPFRLPGIEASRGCPFSCNFCVLTGWERYRYRPVADVVHDIEHRMRFNKNALGLLDDAFVFLDNNLGGSPRYLRELCDALLPLGKTWGCALTWNVLQDADLVKLMGRAGCRYVYTGLESLDPESIASMGKGQNRLKDAGRTIRRAFEAGILCSFGLLVGSDGDTDDYLVRLPEYLSDLGPSSVTFMGIVCPYPETPFFETIAREGRLLPGATSRDFDGYTLCHRPKRLDPSATVEHYKRLCREVGSIASLVKNTWPQLWMSDAPRYKTTILTSALERRSIQIPLDNPARTFIAGRDPIEAWDVARMEELGIEPQRITGAPPQTDVVRLRPGARIARTRAVEAAS